MCPLKVRLTLCRLVVSRANDAVAGEDNGASGDAVLAVVVSGRATDASDEAAFESLHGLMCDV